MLHLPLVRSKCNDRNNSNILFKYSYSIDKEEGEINVHMSFFNNQVNNENMVHQLKAAFHFQREWQHDFDEAVSISKDYESAARCSCYAVWSCAISLTAMLLPSPLAQALCPCGRC